jgi:2'-5' RNA ligase
MAKIAVDVVLLPSEEMTEIAIAANKELLKSNPAKIVLDKENCLPHISLAMGSIDESKIDEIEKILNSIAKEKASALGQLRAIGIDVQELKNGEKVSGFKVEKPPILQSLHIEVISKMFPYFSNEVKADMLVNPSEVNDSTLYWIKNYPDNSGFEKFYPHITVGYGKISNLTLPVEFTASKLALCQLGNECTCRKILASVNL